MDKDLLRIVIILIGALVIAGMLLWNFLSSRKKRRKINFYDNRDPLEHIDESLILKTSDDDFDIVPLGPVIDKSMTQDDQLLFDGEEEPSNYKHIVEPEIENKNQRIEIPTIIQFYIAAKNGTDFKGVDLVKIFAQLGLQYGSVKVFERLDADRRVDFAVASMVEPGVFPNEKLESFTTPGIVFFMQPKEVDNAGSVFADLISTMHQISIFLDGDELDGHRALLSEATIQSLQENLNTI